MPDTFDGEKAFRIGSRFIVVARGAVPPSLWSGGVRFGSPHLLRHFKTHLLQIELIRLKCAKQLKLFGRQDLRRPVISASVDCFLLFHKVVRGPL